MESSSKQSNPLKRPIDSESDVTEAESKKKSKKGGSQMWMHNEKVDKTLPDGSKTRVGICHYCKEEIKADGIKNGTSSLRNHHFNRCTLSPLYQSNAVKGQTVLTNDTMGGALVTHNFNQKKLEQKVLEWVIMDEMPFRAVEGKGFINMWREGQPRFKVPSRKKVAAGVYQLFLQEKAKLEKVIHGQRLSVTTDTWTSIQNINYMVVTGHFIDSDWKLHKRILSFTRITSHAGDDIGRLLETCLNSWGVEKLFSIVVDNASSNTTAIDFMKRRLRSKKNLMLDGAYLHLRCACHILNRIVGDGLVELKTSIKSIRNAVVWLHSSPSRLSKFRDYCKEEGFDSMSTVPMDVKNRWNATYKMLKVALKFRAVFVRLQEYDKTYVEYFGEKVKNKKGEMVKTRVGPPVEEDWVKAESFVHFLGYFYDCTLLLSGTKSCTSHMLFPNIMAIHQELEIQANDFTNFELNKVAFEMQKKFDKYWTMEEVNPLVCIANVLDPRCKMQVINVCLAEVGWSESKIETFVDKIKGDLKRLWVEYKGDRVTNGAAGSGRMQEDGELTDGTAKRGLTANFFEKVKRKNKMEQLNEISNEVDKYLADSVESMDEEDFVLLDWWKGSETRYPIVSKISKDVLAIPSSTVASESAFSLGKRIVDPFRSNLSPKMVETLVCTSDWLRAEEFSFYKDPTDEELELYRELEQIEAETVHTQSSSAPPNPTQTPSAEIE